MIMKKVPFVTNEQLKSILEKYPTPFHLYDEKGIRENAKAMYDAFSWNKGFREYFAVKAEPNPFVIEIMQKEGCGFDCSSLTELMLAKAMGGRGDDIMFSSNDTPAEDFKLADELGAIINLDDITHIDFLEKTLGHLPKKICCRYNPGGVFRMSNGIMDNPGDAKYGMTTPQIFEAYKILKAKGVEEFGIHAFLASNTVTNEYYPMLAKVLFELAVKLKMNKSLLAVAIISAGGGQATFIFLCRGFVNSVPKELDEAAKMDGCGFFRIYYQIILPMLKPILATIALLSFRQGWNEYILPLVFTMTNDKLRPLTVGVNMLKNAGDGTAAWNIMFAGATISIVPILIVYCCFSRFFMGGLTAGAVKG